jgi:hypothetical protein
MLGLLGLKMKLKMRLLEMRTLWSDRSRMLSPSLKFWLMILFSLKSLLKSLLIVWMVKHFVAFMNLLWYSSRFPDGWLLGPLCSLTVIYEPNPYAFLPCVLCIQGFPSLKTGFLWITRVVKELWKFYAGISEELTLRVDGMLFEAKLQNPSVILSVSRKQKESFLIPNISEISVLRALTVLNLSRL